MSGKGHPLPSSEEARHDEIPEHLEREKGCGDDPAGAVQPAADPVNPDGKPYAEGPPDRAEDESDVRDGQAAHQDRGQSIAEAQAEAP
jgi:hypothetical protein